MVTKQIQARHLSTRYQLVRGGDGKPRTTHKLCEVAIDLQLVEVRIADTFERVTFEPRERIRITEAPPKKAPR